MFEKVVILATNVFGGGGAIGDVLSTWQQSGVFDFVIPFLIIFALVFAILSQLNIFGENKAISAIIALSVGLMALQFEFVPRFFSEIFPRLGVGLIVLLVVIILLGMFAPNRTWVTYTFFAAAAVILVVVLANTGTAVEWFSSGFLAGINWQNILPWVILIVLIAVVVGASVKPKEKQDASSRFMRSILGVDDKGK